MGWFKDFIEIKPSSEKDLALNRANDLVTALQAEWTPELQTFIIQKMREIMNKKRQEELIKLEKELNEAYEKLVTV